MNAKTRHSMIFSSTLAALFVTPLLVFAVLYSSGVRRNSFRPAEANIQVKEDNKPSDVKTKEYTLILDADNNYRTDKTVQIYDERSRSDMFIRVRFVPMWYDADGFLCASLNGLTDFRTAKLNDDRNALLFCNGYDETVLTLELDPFWENSWIYQEDDQCFYYGGLLNTGETTPALLRSVVLSQQGYDETEEYTLHLDVLADAVQQYGNAKTDRQWSEPE
jgi:hypothetical protein